MSRNQYLRALERNVDAATKAINELSRENYELRQALKEKYTTLNETRNQKTKSHAS